MKGIQHIEVSNRKVKYKFDLVRNITIVSGNSGSGKTTLYNMIADYTRLQAESGVNLNSTKPCVALTDMDWKNQLCTTRDSIVFIDEGAKYIFTQDFANAVKCSDNYYVIFNRESLHMLPYSVEEIYEIKTSNKYHTFKKMYLSFDRHRYTKIPISKQNSFRILLTEDSESGFQFYTHYFKGSAVKCISSKSSSAIFTWLQEHPTEKVLIVADGAAFGSEMERVMKLCLTHNDAFQLCLPESFEWLILKSGLIKTNHLSEMLENPSNYIESGKFFSWENFFEDYLIHNTEHTVFHYQKSVLNSAYITEPAQRRIAAEIFDK